MALSSCTGCFNFVGIILIVLPTIVFQVVPTNPFGLFHETAHHHQWARITYLHYFVIPCGSIGGILFSRTSPSSSHIRPRDGYVWIGGFFGGMITSIIAYQMSTKLYDETSSTDLNGFPFIVGAVPGLIVYAMVKRCSNYTFPNTYDNHSSMTSSYQPIPTNSSGNHHSNKSSYQNNYSTTTGTTSPGGGISSYDTIV